MQSISGPDFVQRMHFEHHYLVDNLVPCESRILCVGPPKQGKSFLALQLALAVATGTPFMGQQSTKGRVLYLQFDTPPPLWHKRLADLMEVGVIIPPDLHLNLPDDRYNKMNIMSPDHMSAVRDLVCAYNPALVVVDVLRKIHNKRENDSDDMKAIFDVLNDVFAHRALFLIHHTHKLSQDPTMPRPEPSNASRGSSAMSGEVDAIWFLWRSRLTIESRFAESEEDGITCYRDKVTALWTFPTADERAGKLRADILDLRSRFPGLSVSAFSKIAKERLNASYRAVYTALKPPILPALVGQHADIQHQEADHHAEQPSGLEPDRQPS